MGSSGSPVFPIRAFIAFPVPDDFRARIADRLHDLQPRLAGIRLLRGEDLHFTLRFLGPTTRDQMDALAPRLRSAAAACPRDEAQVGGFDLFPERGAPRVLFLGLSPPAGVATLQAACEKAAVEAGFPPDGRRFRPHLTLGRWRGSPDQRGNRGLRGPRLRPDLPRVELGALRLEALVLYRSDLGSGGARYTPLLELPLAG
jgi:RNA 2',3'-cyclic 3'-phosphodiesterase